jgi:uncharacterized membrane protein YjgN (DUF898 family)
LYAILWWILIIVSLGLAYPWAQANLQRDMMRHTSYGKLPGRFEGSGWRLFVRGLPLWLGIVSPLLVAAGFLAAYTDWHAFDATDPDDAKAGPIIVMANDLVARLGTKP